MSENIKEQDPLRISAEERLAHALNSTMPSRSADELLHELMVHQIELEMQNDELRRAQMALEESRDRYSALYEFAPVGYFTLTREGTISEVNLTGAAQLGMDRQNLIHRRFAIFVASDNGDHWHQYFKRTIQNVKQTSCELALKRGDGSIFYARIDSLARVVGADLSVHVTITDITKRTETENELKLSEEILNSINDSVFLLDSDGNFVYLNEAAWKSRGYTKEEMMGMNLHTLNLPEYNQFISSRIKTTLENGRGTFESAHRCKDGSTMHIEINSCKIDTGGRMLILSVIRDITERKRREDELIQSKAELEELYNDAPCGYHSLNSDGRIIRINQTEADWSGYTQNELIGRQINEFMTPDSRAKFLNYFPLFKEDGYIKDIEFEFVRKDGSTFPILLSATAVYDHDRNFVMSRSSMFDISESKWRDAELIASETRFRQLFEKAPIAISWQNENKILEANAAFCKMFGYTQEELSSMTVTDMTHPDYIELTKKMVNKVLTGEIPHYSIEKKYVCKNGEEFWGHAVATEISGPNPQMRYIMGMVQDITERVNQEELRLTEVREQRDVLVREVHHRIKNNLQGVTGLLQTHADLYPELADIIKAAIGRINSIAIIHGLQANALTEEINLEGLIESIVETFGGFVGFTNELHHPVFLSREVAVPIALVLNELLTNAFKHHSWNNPVTITSKIIWSDTFITIINNYDLCRLESTKGGYGLKLVKSLLPRKSATMTVVHTGDIYKVELKLSPPIVTFGQNIIQ